MIQARAPCFSKVYSCFDSFEFLQFLYLMNFQHGPHSLKPGSTTEGLPTLDTRLTCTRFHVKIRVCNSWMHTQNSCFTHHLLAMSQSSRYPITYPEVKPQYSSPFSHNLHELRMIHSQKNKPYMKPPEILQLPRSSPTFWPLGAEVLDRNQWRRLWDQYLAEESLHGAPRWR